jgi:hypothetical protein
MATGRWPVCCICVSTGGRQRGQLVEGLPVVQHDRVQVFAFCTVDIFFAFYFGGDVAGFANFGNFSMKPERVAKSIKFVSL